MVTRLHFKGGVPQTTLAANLNAGVTSLTLADATGWTVTTPFEIIVDKGASTTRERIKVGGQVGTTLNTLTRGQDGTVDQDHVIGNTVELAVPGQWYEDMGGLLQVSGVGDGVYYDGTSFQRLALGTAQQMMKAGATAPSWSWRALPYFTSTASRDTADSAPAGGDAAYIDTNDSAEGIYFYNGTSWRLPWNMPWGVVGTASTTSTQGAITTIVDLTSLTVTFTAVTGRRYRTMGQVMMSSSVSAIMDVMIADGANTQLQQSTFVTAAAANASFNPLAVETITAGSVTRKLRGRASAGTSATLSSATIPGVIVVEDIGPSGAPT